MKKDLNSAWRLKSFYTFTYIIMGFALIFSIANAISEKYLVSIVEVVTVTIVYGLLNYIKKGGDFFLGVNIILLIATSFVLFLFYTGGFSGNGLFWIYPFILLSFFIGGSQLGLFYSLLLSLALILINSFSAFGYLSIPNTVSDVHTSLIAYYLVLAMVYIYEKRIVKIQGILEEQNKDLHREKERAELANEKKSRFLATMSHEIRTPLNAILGFVDILNTRETSQEKKNYLLTIKRSGTMLLGIINDILDFSKIESGKMELLHEPFSPLHDFDNIMRLFYAEAILKDIRFVTFIDPKIPVTLYGDSLRLKQVLSNLLSNAFKFTPNGGHIGVEIHWNEEKKQLYFMVEDSGIGITKDKLESIFNAFEQEDSSTTRVYGGTGLGLSIAEKILNMMDSHIYVSSEKEHGSRFSFYVTFDEYEVNETHLHITKKIGICTQEENTWIAHLLQRYLESYGAKDIVFCSEDNEGVCHGLHDSDLVIVTDGINTEAFSSKEVWQLVKEDVSFGKQHLNLPITPQSFEAFNEENNSDVAQKQMQLQGHVLVVEDNLSNRTLAGIFLQELGLEVSFAVNGFEGVNSFVTDRENKQEIDIILMDENMPVMTGSEACKKIREYETLHELSTIPIIACSANVYETDKAGFLKAGMNDTIEKPFEQQTIAGIMKQYLKEK